MHPEYFETRFKLGLPTGDLPEDFTIVTAIQTTGMKWPNALPQTDCELLIVAIFQPSLVHLHWSVVGFLLLFSAKTRSGAATSRSRQEMGLDGPGLSPFRRTHTGRHPEKPQAAS
jgi:hypothetical protein